ncbi:MAG: carbon storage regulator CsrA [Planctomycetota bacterium]|jgi:carbon storage regulator
MLILSRKLNEQIVIGDGIVVTVVGIRGGNVRLGIEAPTHIPVHRKEIYEALRKQARQHKVRAVEEEADHSRGKTSPPEGP